MNTVEEFQSLVHNLLRQILVLTFPIEDNHVSTFPNTPHSKRKDRFPREVTSITAAIGFPIESDPFLEIAHPKSLIGYAHSQLYPHSFDPSTISNGMNDRLGLSLTYRA